MGTRGAIGFVVDGQEKVTYNHFDSYPEGLGDTVAKFCASYTAEKMREAARRIELVDEDTNPTPKQIAELRGYSDLSVSSKSEQDWYCLLRNAQGQLEPYMKELHYMIDNKAFLQDSLFCEYAYLINLDTETLEFYIGFNKDMAAPGRYAALNNGRKNQGYCGVRLAAEYPLSGIIAADALVSHMKALADKRAESEAA